jgi:hypothetical protein
VSSAAALVCRERLDAVASAATIVSVAVTNLPSALMAAPRVLLVI